MDADHQKNVGYKQHLQSTSSQSLCYINSKGKFLNDSFSYRMHRVKN